MKHITKQFNIQTSITATGLPAHSLFLDIETTGLSPEKSIIYLIGASWYEGTTLHFAQWLADTPADEPAVIAALFTRVTPDTTLVTFNGTTFDIPFIERRAKKLGLPYTFAENDSFDLFKQLKPVKKFLGLKSGSQKSFESFLGAPRLDTENGGTLIGVYWKYVRSHYDKLAHLCLLHNEEDVVNMSRIASLLSYRSLLYGDLSVTAPPQITCKEGLLSAVLTVSAAIPVPLDLSCERLRFRMQDDRMHLALPVADASLYLYFPDYKNYYYLPDEDMAIHKSVGEFVPKERKVKAKKETARVKCDGRFIACAGISREGIHIYRDTLSSPAYLSLSEIDTASEDFWNRFVSEDLPLLLAERS